MPRTPSKYTVQLNPDIEDESEAEEEEEEEYSSDFETCSSSDEEEKGAEKIFKEKIR